MIVVVHRVYSHHWAFPIHLCIVHIVIKMKWRGGVIVVFDVLLFVGKVYMDGCHSGCTSRWEEMSMSRF